LACSSGDKFPPHRRREPPSPPAERPPARSWLSRPGPRSGNTYDRPGRCGESPAGQSVPHRRNRRPRRLSSGLSRGPTVVYTAGGTHRAAAHRETSAEATMPAGDTDAPRPHLTPAALAPQGPTPATVGQSLAPRSHGLVTQHPTSVYDFSPPRPFWFRVPARPSSPILVYFCFFIPPFSL